jgi:5-methylcytosine-specific restriction endonuclease McrBC regulatory subunit McrC
MDFENELNGKRNSILLLIGVVSIHFVYYMFGKEEKSKIIKTQNSKLSKSIFVFMLYSGVILSLYQMISYFISLKTGFELNWLITKHFFKDLKHLEYLEFTKTSFPKSQKILFHIMFNGLSLIIGGFFIFYFF